MEGWFLSFLGIVPALFCSIQYLYTFCKQDRSGLSSFQICHITSQVLSFPYLGPLWSPGMNSEKSFEIKLQTLIITHYNNIHSKQFVWCLVLFYQRNENLRCRVQEKEMLIFVYTDSVHFVHLNVVFVFAGKHLLC